ncbi:MAG: hypothetical protein Q9218_003172 [Villophora microphyllina]
MFLSVGDILQLSKLAADLYTKGWVVARDAPQEFRDLVHDLLLLKDVLYVVHSKIKGDSDLYGDPTKRVLQRCSESLFEFSILVQKYENLALSDRGHWFRRLQWSREQDSIKECHNKLQKHQQLLNLVLQGRNLQGEEQTEDISYNGGVQWSDTFATTSDEQHLYTGGPRLSFKTIDSAQTLIPPHLSPPLTHKGPSLLSRQRSNQQYTNADLTELPPVQKSTSQITGSSSLSDSYRSGGNGRPNKSLIQRTSDSSVGGRLRQMSLGTLASEDSWGQGSSDHTNFQPLEIPEQREKHECPKELADAFLQSFDTVSDEVLDESWIRVATWWLLKTAAFRDYSHWENTTSRAQAYVDLLKSSWILDELIKERKVAGDLTKPHPRKLVIDLLKALKSDLYHRHHDKSYGDAPDIETLLKQDPSLLESFEQTVEAKENVPRAMDDLTTSQRWITIDKDHGGFPDEKILFRCFVNAQIGQRHERSKSSNAPYVILLWTKTGESEISVSLCNQRDTLNLSRKLTAEDLEDWKSLDKNATSIHLEFPTQSAEINFLIREDIEGFQAGPMKFFEAVKGRDPCTGELTLFQTVIKSYRNVEVSSNMGQNDNDSTPKSLGHSELRLYEQMAEVCWKTVRRLVVSSAADSKKLGSVSHWLPISNVRLQVEDCTVTVSWSDCGHLEKKERGNYNPYYSYVYHADKPNQKIILVFGHSDDAQRFEDCILFLTETPPQVRLSAMIGSSSAFQETRIYSLFDQDDPDRGYHGIVYAKKSPKTYHFSKICYVYRDLDFSFRNQNPAEIDLQHVRIPHYISNRHKMLARPREREIVPQFREVTWLHQPLEMTFSCDEDAVRFLSGLTGWRLKFYRQSAKLVLTDTSQLRKPKKTHKGAEIQLWEKAAPEGGIWTQLVVRSAEGDSPWLTARLEASGGGLGLPTGGVAELKGLAIHQGKDLDTKYMQANSTEGAITKPCWKFIVTFKEPGGRSVLPRRRSISNATQIVSPSTQELQDSSHESHSLRATTSVSSDSARRLMVELRYGNMSEPATLGQPKDDEGPRVGVPTAELVAPQPLADPIATNDYNTSGPGSHPMETGQEEGEGGTAQTLQDNVTSNWRLSAETELSNDEDLRFPGQLALQTTLPVASVCSNCHHFHANKALQLPLDHQQHTQVTCDHCEHPISAVERTSMPTTLPSGETNGPGARSVSLTRQYEERKQAIRGQEWRERAERLAIAEKNSRMRAEREAERMEDEERERVAAAIVARRRREELDRRGATEAVLERERREDTRLCREERERQLRIQDERDRLARQRTIRIPRGPRHERTRYENMAATFVARRRGAELDHRRTAGATHADSSHATLSTSDSDSSGSTSVRNNQKGSSLILPSQSEVEKAIFVPSLDILEGHGIGEDSKIFNEEGEVFGQLTEGDTDALADRKINDAGEILDEDGDVIGRVEVMQPQVEDMDGKSFGSIKESSAVKHKARRGSTLDTPVDGSVSSSPVSSNPSKTDDTLPTAIGKDVQEAKTMGEGSVENGIYSEIGESKEPGTLSAVSSPDESDRQTASNPLTSTAKTIDISVTPAPDTSRSQAQLDLRKLQLELPAAESRGDTAAQKALLQQFMNTMRKAYLSTSAAQNMEPSTKAINLLEQKPNRISLRARKSVPSLSAQSSDGARIKAISTKGSSRFFSDRCPPPSNAGLRPRLNPVLDRWIGDLFDLIRGKLVRVGVTLRSTYLSLAGSEIISLGLLLERLKIREPPLPKGTQRVRWTCSCGRRLYDDYLELKPGAAAQLKIALDTPGQQRPSGPYPVTSPRDYAVSWPRASGSSSSPLLPMSQTPNPASVGASPDSSASNGQNLSAITTCDQESRWLLVCARASQRPTSLLHLNVCSTKSDQQLFTELRRAYQQLKKAWYYRLSLRTVQSIRFIQFELHPRDLIDVRKVPDMPSGAKKDEYLYQPCDLLPPVGENLMTHLFHHPHEANEKAITFLRSPKKRKQRLAVCPQAGTNLGWGIHLVEGYAVTKVWSLAFAMYCISSLVFGIAWSVLKHDIQGAFAIAAYFVALAGLGIGTFQAYVE